MYRPNKSKTLIKLQPINSLPVYEDFVNLLQMAEEKLDSIIQLPWLVGEKYHSISVTSKIKGDPEWTLRTGKEPRTFLLWTHNSGDVGLIFNLAISECGGQQATKDIMQGNYAQPAQPVSGAISAAAPVSFQEVAKPTHHVSAEHAGFNLSGELSEFDLPSLLQTIAMSKKTGRLSIRHRTDSVDIYLQGGVPIHALAADLKGDDVIIEALLWEQGTFGFHPDELPTERTVVRRLDAMLMEGVTLIDYNQHLTRKSGLKMDSYLSRKFPDLQESEFELQLADALPINLQTQKDFYNRIDEVSTLLDILRSNPMPRAQWLPILFNLVTSQLVVLSNVQPESAKRANLESIGVDRRVIENAHQGMVRTETGIFSYPCFLYFLEQEYARYGQTKLPFSVIVFDVLVRKDTGYQPLSNTAISRMGKVIGSILNRFDVVGHFQALEYALLLPHTTSDSANLIAQSLVDLLIRANLDGAQAEGDVAIAMGIASLPGDCSDLGTLLGAANAAKNRSKRGEATILKFKS